MRLTPSHCPSERVDRAGVLVDPQFEEAGVLFELTHERLAGLARRRGAQRRNELLCRTAEQLALGWRELCVITLELRLPV